MKIHSFLISLIKVSFVLLITIYISGCVTTEKYNKVNSELNAAKIVCSSQEKQIEDLQKENEALNKDLASLKKNIAQKEKIIFETQNSLKQAQTQIKTKTQELNSARPSTSTNKASHKK